MVKITITLDPENHTMTVDGPVHDEIICFGAFEAAKLLIHENNKATPKSNLRIVSANVLPKSN